MDSPAGTLVNSEESLKMAKLCEDFVKESGLETYNKC